MQGWTTLMGQAGFGVILAWYLYYTTTVTFPKISDSHLEKIERISEKQNATVEKVCESFEACIREERQARKEELKELKDAFECRNHTGK